MATRRPDTPADPGAPGRAARLRDCRRPRLARRVACGAALLFAGGAVVAALSVPATSAQHPVRELSDAELDEIYAQGLAIVDVSFGLHATGLNVAFQSTTTIDTSHTSVGGGAEVSLLGGLIDLVSGVFEGGGADDALGPTPAAPGQPSVTVTRTPDAPPVRVTFGKARGGQVLGVNARDVGVSSVVNISVERADSTGAMSRVMRDSFLSAF